MNFLRNFGWYIAKRVLMLIPLLVGITIVTFFLVRLGDTNPAALIAGPTASEAEIEAVSEELGLDEPLLTQYWTYIGNALHGDLGTSWITRRPVATEVRERLPVTLELVTLGTIGSVVFGLVVGFVSGMRERRPVDAVLRVVTLGGISVPIFWLGLLMIFLFFANWQLAPPPLGRMDVFLSTPDRVTGFPLLDAVIQGEWEAAGSMVKHLVLPVLTMILVIGATIAKQMRASVIEVRGSQMVRYARACGMPQWRLWKVVLHNSLPSIVTYIAIAYSLQLGGSVLIEMIFSWGGLGQLGVSAIQRADFAVVQAYVFVMGVLAAAIYLFADLIVATIDPRVSYR